MSCCATDEPICPCEQFVFPTVITNPPGLDTIAYRLGDYTSFRQALLLPLAGETQLTQSNGTQVTPIWRPGASGDLAVQMIEWWAYLCDILTFYNERAANQSYLGTADLPESVNRLVALLGYRPRPGIGATGTLAALATGSTSPFTLPVGFQVQSKPGPGQQPQIFELQTAVTITPPIGPPGTSAAQGTADVAPPTQPPQLVIPPTQPAQPASGSLLLKGAVSTVAIGDELLLLHNQWVGTDSNYAVVVVTSVSPEKDSSGNTNTRVLYSITYLGADFPSDPITSDYQLLKSGQSAHPYPYLAITTLPSGQNSIDMSSITRQIQVGDPILFEDPRPNATNNPQLVSVAAYKEVVYYANNPSDPTQPPPQLSYSGATLQPAIPIPHSQLTFTPTLASTWDMTVLQVYYAWKSVGQLIDTPATTVGGQTVGSGTGSTTAGSGTGGTTVGSGTGSTTAGSGTGGTAATAANSSPLTLTPATGESFTVPSGSTTVMVQDVNGNGAIGTVGSSSSISVGAPVPVLVPPLQVLFNLLSVTRGKTVANEVLGSGNAQVAGQDFVLQNSPVTYLSDPNSISGDNYSSTVTVWVNGLAWSEVQSFYGQSPNAQVYITREDEQGQTHVVFGDGQNGSLLPTGVNNVVASYRYGSGAAAPAAGSLTVVLQQQPGLRSILNPVAVGGGSDPDPPGNVRQLAPQSVTTFGRAISVDDFQTIASQTPGVTRVKVAIAFNPLSQRPRVTVWVGDDANAVAAVQQAFAGSADPNRQPLVVLAQAVQMTLSLTIVYNPQYIATTVQAAVQTALVDPDVGLLGLNVVGIGQVFYDSQVYAACLAVPGVVAVHSLVFTVTNSRIAPMYTRLVGSDLNRFVLTQSRPAQPQTQSVSTAPSGCCGQRHDPGPDSYLFLPDDAQCLTINLEAAS
jgi:hypothetical protein